MHPPTFPRRAFAVTPTRASRSSHPACRLRESAGVRRFRTRWRHLRQRARASTRASPWRRARASALGRPRRRRSSANTCRGNRCPRCSTTGPLPRRLRGSGLSSKGGDERMDDVINPGGPGRGPRARGPVYRHCSLHASAGHPFCTCVQPESASVHWAAHVLVAGSVLTSQ